MHAGLPHHPVANVLPVRPFNQALLGPFAEHTGVSWHSLAVLAAWGAAWHARRHLALPLGARPQ